MAAPSCGTPGFHLFRGPMVAAAVMVALAAVGACHRYEPGPGHVTNVRFESVPLTPQVVRSPVKAHLMDGSTILFSDGVTLDDSLVTGAGMRYDIQLNPVGAVPGVALDSVVAMESFRTEQDLGRTILYGVPGYFLYGGASTALAVAIFGSCPTVYSEDAGVEVLEAEAFSYSIAPMFEARDVDRLAVGADDRGEVRLEVRNEALETHYINHLELIEVSHPPGERVVPDPEGRPVGLGRPLELRRAADRDGRDVTALLSGRDDVLFTSSVSRIDAAIASGAGEVEDHIELEVPVPSGTTQVGLHLRLRNSLLATVLFYDMMLGDRGARALDWLGRDLGEIGPAAELGQWAADNLGMRVSVLEGGAWREVARIRDKGPLAWDDVAVVVPVSPASSEMSVTIRLAFPADHWRIDHVAPFETARYAEGRVVPLSMIRALDGSEQADMLGNVASSDDSYLATTPGHAFEVVFSPGLSARQDGADGGRTFFLASQGYYIEWIRQSWLTNGRETEPFQPGPEALVEALRRWRAARETMEEQFYATRIPVR